MPREDQPFPAGRAREEQVRAYLPLVRLIAGRLALGLPPHVAGDDLLSYGMFGLLAALDGFDPIRGVRFETYAAPRIRGAMLDGLRREEWAPGLRRKARQLERTYADLEARLGREPTDAELATSLGVSAAEVERRRQGVATVALLSLEEGVAQEGEEGLRVVDRLVDERSPDPAAMLEQAEVREELARALEQLAEKERLVISLYYYEGLTAREVAAVLGLTPARISQLHSRALLRLRGRLSRARRRRD